MVTASLGIITGISYAIFFRKKNSWFKIHKSFNLFSFVGMSAGVCMAAIYVSGSSGKHLNGIHQLAGLTTFTIVLVTLLLGFYQFKAQNSLVLRTTHRWLGRLSLLSITVVLILGLILTKII
jgi:hypothetical protein